MEKIRVLHVHGGLMLYGGTETFIMNSLRYLDKSKFEIDVLIHGEGEGVYDNEIKELGCNVIVAPVFGKNPLTYNKEIKRILRDGKYDIVHSHLNSMNTPILKEAKKQGVGVRISHAHASEYYSTNKLKNFVNAFNKRRIHKYATDLFSCSVVAGDFTYEGRDYSIWYNSVDLNKYSFNETNRNTIRSKYGVEDKDVFINIGRFNFQKNHIFLIDIFSELVKVNKDSVLMLVGSGEEEDNIRNYVGAKGLDDNVIFVGLIDNVHEFLSASDHFLLPSLFEGLPYVLVEAQATGLQIFSADTVAPETKLIDEFYFIPINSATEWVRKICEKSNYERYSRSKELTDAGFEVVSSIDLLEKFYLDNIKGVKG